MSNEKQKPSDKQQGAKSTYEVQAGDSLPEKRKRTREVLSLGLVGLVAVIAAPRPGFITESPEPPESPKTLIEGAEQSAKIPFDPTKDELILDGTIRVKPNNSAKNTPSEATLSDPRVVDYIAAHPDESSSLETSVNSLPGSTEEIVIVSDDVDGDGDLDTVAKLVEK